MRKKDLIFNPFIKQLKKKSQIMNSQINSQQNALEFRKVYFNYKSDAKSDISTLTGINLTVPKGENRTKLKYIFFL